MWFFCWNVNPATHGPPQQSTAHETGGSCKNWSLVTVLLANYLYDFYTPLISRRCQYQHVGVSENSVPHCTQWFCWSLFLLNCYFIGNIPYFQIKWLGNIPNIFRQAHVCFSLLVALTHFAIASWATCSCLSALPGRWSSHTRRSSWDRRTSGSH